MEGNTEGNTAGSGAGTAAGGEAEDDAARERRWRELARSAQDLPDLQRAGSAVRAELRAFDLADEVRALAVLAEESHALARFVQADLEAARLVRAAGEPVPDDALAAFPPEPGSVRADRVDTGGWALTGTQRRSVHPGALRRALVLAGTDDGDRWFGFAVDAPGVVRDRSPLRTIAPEDPNGPVTFTRAPAEPVGAPDAPAVGPSAWEDLLHDAACWVGACRWLRRSIAALPAVRADPADLVRLGRADTGVATAWDVVAAAVPVVVADPRGPRAELVARRAVAVVATAADTVIRSLALVSDARIRHEDTTMPSRVAQLQIALRRFDAEANLRAVGVLVSEGVSA